MNKKLLAKIIQEAVTVALTELDRGDIKLQQASNADMLVRQADQHLDALKALAQALYKKQDAKSTQILKAMNTSLAGFVDKVTQTIRPSKS